MFIQYRDEVCLKLIARKPINFEDADKMIFMIIL